MEKKNTGKLLYEDENCLPIKKEKQNVTSGVVLLVVGISMIILYLLLQTNGPMLLLGGIFGISVGIFVIFFHSFSSNRIYENGVTSDNHHIIDYIKDRTYHPYQDISVIGYCKDPNADQIMLTIYGESTEDSITRFFSGGSEEFFERLVRALEKNCPQATWIRHDYDRLTLFNWPLPPRNQWDVVQPDEVIREMRKVSKNKEYLNSVRSPSKGRQRSPAQNNREQSPPPPPSSERQASPGKGRSNNTRRS